MLLKKPKRSMPSSKGALPGGDPHRPRRHCSARLAGAGTAAATPPLAAERARGDIALGSRGADDGGTVRAQMVVKMSGGEGLARVKSDRETQKKNAFESMCHAFVTRTFSAFYPGTFLNFKNQRFNCARPGEKMFRREVRDPVRERRIRRRKSSLSAPCSHVFRKDARWQKVGFSNPENPFSKIFLCAPR